MCFHTVGRVELVSVDIMSGVEGSTYVLETEELVTTIRPYRASQIGNVLV